jgi:hypothetical protein
MIPMIIGPFIGARVISNSNVFYNDLGTIKPVPTPEIFIVSAIAVLFILVPLFIAFKNEKKVEEIA